MRRRGRFRPKNLLASVPEFLADVVIDGCIELLLGILDAIF